MFKKVGDLKESLGRDVAWLSPVLVDGQDLVDGHSQHLGVAPCIIVHLEHTDGPAGNHGATSNRKGRDHKDVHRVTVILDGLGHITVVTGIVHGGHHEAVDKECPCVLVDLVLDGVALGGDLDDDVEFLRKSVSGGNTL